MIDGGFWGTTSWMLRDAQWKHCQYDRDNTDDEEEATLTNYKNAWVSQLNRMQASSTLLSIHSFTANTGLLSFSLMQLVSRMSNKTTDLFLILKKKKEEKLILWMYNVHFLKQLY